MRALSDADVAALYDVLNPWDPDKSAADAFHHAMVMVAGDVLDVGCGTGSMLHHARTAGHTGRLVGIDPDREALARARRRTDAEWVEGRASDICWDREFDLATMASHTFQCLVEDDEVRSSLLRIHAALRDGGRFVFETRHPQARAWEEWRSAKPADVTTPSGRQLRVSYDIDPIVDDVVSLAEVYSELDGDVVRVDRGRLRFMDVPTLNEFLAEAGFAVDEQFGDWDGGLITPESHEVITVARS